MQHPFTRADVALIGTAATMTGVSNAVKLAAVQSEEIGGATDATMRFLELPVVRFAWDAQPVYLTPTDLIAVISTAILLIRFLTWALAPGLRWLWGFLNGKAKKD